MRRSPGPDTFNPMTARPWLAAALVLLTGAAGAGCGGGDAGGDAAPAVPGAALRDQPPVPLDVNTPVEYPPDLFAQGIEGTVVLRLFVDEEGVVVADSVRVEESSGQPGLDSAAVAAAPRLRYAPAVRGGNPVAAPFRQPIHFRRPGGSAP